MGSASAAIAILTVSTLAWASSARADIRLPRLVGDHMVLQRDSPITLWGWADPGERIAIVFRDQRRTTRADAHGEWSVRLAPLAAGGPDSMQLAGHRTITLTDILVGDVWLASGQSNMEFPLQSQGWFGGVNDAEREVAQAQYPRMRLFQVARDIGFAPKDDLPSGGWQAVTPATAARFSAVAYLFGRELQRRHAVPIGLIESSWGGTPAECWISAGGLRQFPEFSASIARLSQVDDRAIAAYRDYLSVRNAWYAMHGREDRGRVEGQDLWAAATYPDMGWPTSLEPQPWPRKVIKEFDGTMWFRRTIQLDADAAAQALRLHLTHLREADTTWFNGVRIGAVEGEIRERDYGIPAGVAHAGNNTITVRIAGSYTSGDGYVGMLGEAADLYLQIGPQRLPLAGTWSYQPGPDLAALPEPPPMAEFMTAFPQAPVALYDGMIAPLIRYRIRGAIWYQGEANTARAVQYRTLFPALIRDWRSQWGYELPFLFVQLAGYGADAPEPKDYAWAELREAQASALALPRTGMAVAIDVGDATDIHPRDKQTVAYRLALSAESVAYGKSLVASGPRYRSMRREGNQIRLHFEDDGSGLVFRDAPGSRELGRGFSIAGPDGRFRWAIARLDGADVVVSNAEVPAPTAVRYDWGNTPDGNLYNRAGLPAPPFRTDAPPVPGR
jgi:sialate O-acetylesterase